VVKQRPAAGHDATDVGMVVQVLAPGMEHGEEADLGISAPIAFRSIVITDSGGS
jgi:hypothetical protein